VQGIQTTATFDHAADEFVVHTPTRGLSSGGSAGRCTGSFQRLCAPQAPVPVHARGLRRLWGPRLHCPPEVSAKEGLRPWMPASPASPCQPWRGGASCMPFLKEHVAHDLPVGELASRCRVLASSSSSVFVLDYAGSDGDFGGVPRGGDQGLRLQGGAQWRSTTGPSSAPTSASPATTSSTAWGPCPRRPVLQVRAACVSPPPQGLLRKKERSEERLSEIRLREVSIARG